MTINTLEAIEVRYTAYYSILPNSNLLALLEKKELMKLSFLEEPVLWSNEEGGRTALLKEDHISSIKIFYICYLTKMVLSREDAGFFDFEEPILCEANFDRYWNIYRHDGVETTYQIAQELLDGRFRLKPEEKSLLEPFTLRKP